VGAVSCLGLLLVVGCGADAVSVDPPRVTDDEAETCGALVDALPDAVADELRRPVEPATASAAAWGDPPVVLRCGVETPAGFDRFATCQETNGVGWFVPDAAIEDQDSDVVMTTIGRTVNVEVVVPGSRRPPAAAMVDLAGAIKRTVPEVDPCV